MSFTLKVLIGLVLGLASGIAIAAAGPGAWQRLPGLVEPIGLIFVGAIRMTVIPLVVSGLIVGVAGMRDARAVGRLGGRALAIFVAFIAAATVFSMAATYPFLGRLHIEPAVAERLRAGAEGVGRGAAETAQSLPSWSRWLVDLVPVNVFKAASDGSILPLIVFALAFGLALTAVEAERRRTVVTFFHGVSDAMLVLVRWVLVFTPLGVFALAVPLGARMGLTAAGALLSYIGLLSLVAAAYIALVLYPAAVVLGGVPLRRFAKAAAPAQAVAFSSRSSLAALPAVFEGARRGLGWPEDLTIFFVPLAASIFRVGGAIAQGVAVLFVARLYGVDLGAAQLATIVLTVIVTSFTIPGIPAGAIITMAPVLAAAGVPVEGIGVLMGVDTIPDMFRTMANVTGWFAGGSILARAARGRQVVAGAAVAMSPRDGM
ncbi:MAG TPA: dicarboxylate/amino acid:cation symporter [Vicinamibacterales bacterium]|nr:dicarboxylate/amino acid:cation symporter [Vicinamibacterales bacterium]